MLEPGSWDLILCSRPYVVRHRLLPNALLYIHNQFSLTPMQFVLSMNKSFSNMNTKLATFYNIEYILMLL